MASPYVLMLQTDPEDQYLTESVLAEINPDLKIKFLHSIHEMNDYIAEAGDPSIILLNDNGDLSERAHTLRQLKGNRDYSHIPVVVLGENSSSEYVKECYRAGANTFIAKPSSVDAAKKKVGTFFSYWFEVAEV
jgi:DNA-binding NarL/FixJ family response regulator